MKAFLLAALVGITLGGCITPRDRIDSQPGAILPAEAIQRAANAAPEAVPGLFWLKVKATGSERGKVFLNSEADYRDQRNVSVVISPEAAKALTEKLGENVESAYMGKSILVRGAARRVTIYFSVNGKQTNKYYYQTHVYVTKANQIAVAGGG